MWYGLKRLVHCVSDGGILIAAQCHCENQCLDWMDSLCWSVSPFLLQFRLSVSAQRYTPSLPVIAAIFLHNYDNTGVTFSTFFSAFPFIPNVPLAFFKCLFSFPSLCNGHRDTVEKTERERVEQPFGFISKTVRWMTVQHSHSHIVNHYIFQNTRCCHLSICTSYLDLIDFGYECAFDSDSYLISCSALGLREEIWGRHFRRSKYGRRRSLYKPDLCWSGEPIFCFEEGNACGQKAPSGQA